MTVEDRLAVLEARLRQAEDHLEILNLVNSYGPLVDSGWADEAPNLWADGGSYDFGLPGGLTGKLGKQEMHTMYESEDHMRLVNTGSAHLAANPKIVVDGDTARAVGYSFVILREDERWYVWRGAVNEWSFDRTEKGWRIKHRLNRTLDGSPESHQLMRRIVEI
jgi:hypothetical protein